MPIGRSEVRSGSSIFGAVNPRIVYLPNTDFAGLVDQTVSAGTQILFTGAHCVNIGTGGVSAELRMPYAPVITTAANADTFTISLEGYDHLGRYVTENITKSGTTRQTACPGIYAYSKITKAWVVAASGGSLRLRLGFCYTGWAFNVVEFGTNIPSSGVVAIRRLPLPMGVRASTDVAGIRSVGNAGGGSVISRSPAAATLTFSSTSDTLVTSSTAWSAEPAAVLTSGATTTFTATTGVDASGSPWSLVGIYPGMIAVAGGSIGIITLVGVGSAATITVAGWTTASGVAGTPSANSVITIYRALPSTSSLANIVQAGDIAYTADGIMGEIVSATTNAVTVRGWWRGGVQITDMTDITGAAGKMPWITIIRPAAGSRLDSSGGSSPSFPLVPVTGYGLDVASSTYAFNPQMTGECPFDTAWEVTFSSESVY